MKVTLTVIAGPHLGKQFEFDGHDTFIVGRGKNAQFRLSQQDKFFSRNHFLVEVNPPLCRLVDLNSSNGTYVNGKRVASADLQNGDKIFGGDTSISISFQSAPTNNSPFTEVSRENLNAGNPCQTQAPAQKRNLKPSNVPQTLVLPAKPSQLGLPVTEAFIGGIDRAAPAPVVNVASGFAGEISGYQMVRMIGRGGMGVVYEAISTADQSRVAIKVIAPHVVATPDDVSRFIREASILRALLHPNIVRYREMNQYGDNVYFVMDFIDGITVQKLVADRPTPLPVRQSIDLTVQLLSALEFAHKNGYVHRDIKPANLLLSAQDGYKRLYLADFGLARAYQSSKLSGLTMTGDIGGTTPFMPPEQVTNFRKVAPGADQYSVAASLYYMLTKLYVYDFPRDVAKQLLIILQDDPIRIETRRPDIPPQLASIIHKALSRNVEDRFPTVAEFRNALQSLKLP